jgi:hypothetical protein
MMNLSMFELEEIKKICQSVGTEYFTLERKNASGIGSILTVTYETEIADYPAKVTVEVSGVDRW